MESHLAATLLSAMGGGLTMGLVLRQWEGRSRLSPSEHVKVGTKALALAGAAAAATYLSRAKSKTEESFQRLDWQHELSAASKWLRKLLRGKWVRLS